MIGWVNMALNYCSLPGAKPAVKPMQRIYYKRPWLSPPGRVKVTRRTFLWCIPPSGGGPLILPRKTDRRTTREEVTTERSEDCWFDDTIEQKETAWLIDRAIKNMPEKFREVVMLKIWSELTFAQIAQTLDIPLNTAASRYRYGLEILKRDANLKES